MVPTVLIEVRGGVVQRIMAEGEVDYILIDWDNIKQGDEEIDSGRATEANFIESFDPEYEEEANIIKQLKEFGFK